MLGVFMKSRNPWEELYDPNNNTYFYRNKDTDEFTRINPNPKAEDPPPTSDEPLWRTREDYENGEFYWEDMDTGKIVYFRPTNGTFVSEVSLSDFRRYHPRYLSKRSQIQSSRLSTRPSTKSLKTPSTVTRASITKSRKSYSIVNDTPGNTEFQQLFGDMAPNTFDAAALFLDSTPPLTSIPQNNNHDDKLIEEKEIDEEKIDADTVEANSAFASDNPLFRY